MGKVSTSRAMKMDRVSGSKSVAGNGMNPMNKGVVKNPTPGSNKLSAEMYLSMNLGKAPKLFGRPVKGTLGASESVKPGGRRDGGAY